MMNIGSPKLLVICDVNQELEEDSEDEELNFQPHVTSREKLVNALHRFIVQVLMLFQLLGACLRRIGRGSGRGRVTNSENTNEDIGTEEEGRSMGSLDHAQFQVEQEATPEVPATPLPGETVTSAQGEPAMWAPQKMKHDMEMPQEDNQDTSSGEVKVDMDPSSVPLPSSHSSL